MATQEFYVRSASETEARGPFTQEHLVSLVENGQITKETLFYDATSEQWVRIGDNAELDAMLFPEKKSLKLKAKENINSLNVRKEEDAPIVVEDMLAAAEGRTADTKDKLDPTIARERAAAIGLYSTIALLIISAASLILPSIDIVITLDPVAIIQHPLVIVGALQTIIALLLILQVTQIYPLVRFSAALNLGFTGFLFWTQGQLVPLAALAVGSVGLYFCTVFINFLGIGIAAGLGFAGMLGFAFYSLT
ncbi:MAG TPA: DUF4339 domain-containing protein [Rariglobus sp.]|jgi:hypothetical protein|nr:DUF4339 domain-containing protein [Rariglobus sp.]